MKDPQTLQELLRPIQESKGYFFNRKQEQVTALLEGLLKNRERYGYMACPCRLASGKREKDRDITCPCDYREADVTEFGSCYCGLYVSARWNNGEIELQRVPERRPPHHLRR
jgi:ferredoxin-thioredoxin reductase catalytic subunit